VIAPILHIKRNVIARSEVRTTKQSYKLIHNNETASFLVVTIETKRLPRCARNDINYGVFLLLLSPKHVQLQDSF
jgi:hypothetical protein